MKTKLVYTGRRIFDAEKGKVGHAFAESGAPGAQPYFFTKARWVEIGATYEAEKTDKGMAIAFSPKQIEKGFSVSDEVKERWQNLDREAYALMRRVRICKKAERLAKAVALSCGELRRALRGLTYSGKRAFMDAIIDEIETMERAKK